MEFFNCQSRVITNNGDKIDWIHDKVGYVVQYDKNQLHDAIIKVLSDEKLKRRFGETAKTLVEKEFNWDEIVKKIEKLYETIQVNKSE